MLPSTALRAGGPLLFPQAYQTNEYWRQPIIDANFTKEELAAGEVQVKAHFANHVDPRLRYLAGFSFVDDLIAEFLLEQRGIYCRPVPHQVRLEVEAEAKAAKAAKAAALKAAVAASSWSSPSSSSSSSLASLATMAAKAAPVIVAPLVPAKAEPAIVAPLVLAAPASLPLVHTSSSSSTSLAPAAPPLIVSLAPSRPASAAALVGPMAPLPPPPPPRGPWIGEGSLRFSEHHIGVDAMLWRNRSVAKPISVSIPRRVDRAYRAPRRVNRGYHLATCTTPFALWNREPDRTHIDIVDVSAPGAFLYRYVPYDTAGLYTPQEAWTMLGTYPPPPPDASGAGSITLITVGTDPDGCHSFWLAYMTGPVVEVAGQTPMVPCHYYEVSWSSEFGSIVSSEKPSRCKPASVPLDCVLCAIATPVFGPPHRLIHW